MAEPAGEAAGEPADVALSLRVTYDVPFPNSTLTSNDELLYVHSETQRLILETWTTGHLMISTFCPDVFEVVQRGENIFSFSAFDNQVWCNRWNNHLKEPHQIFQLENTSPASVAMTASDDRVIIADLVRPQSIRQYSLEGRCVAETRFEQSRITDICYVGGSRIAVWSHLDRLLIIYDIYMEECVSVQGVGWLEEGDDLRCFTSDGAGYLYAALRRREDVFVIRKAATGKHLTITRTFVFL